MHAGDKVFSYSGSQGTVGTMALSKYRAYFRDAVARVIDELETVALAIDELDASTQIIYEREACTC